MVQDPGANTFGNGHGNCFVGQKSFSSFPNINSPQFKCLVAQLTLKFFETQYIAFVVTTMCIETDERWP